MYVHNSKVTVCIISLNRMHRCIWCAHDTNYCMYYISSCLTDESSQHLLKNHHEMIDHYSRMYENMQRINATVTHLLTTVNMMQRHLDERINWFSTLLHMAGELKEWHGQWWHHVCLDVIRWIYRWTFVQSMKPCHLNLMYTCVNFIILRIITGQQSSANNVVMVLHVVV